jgi:hypothetical protein
MDPESVIREFLNFIGVGRSHFRPRPAWRIQELQYASVYFGLAGEDALVRNHFKRLIHKNRPGRYVDIGCAWPSMISNTYYLYMLGWRGICVDANKAFEPKWTTVRPEDQFLWGAVAEGAAQLYWAAHKENLGASIVGDTDAAPSVDHLPGIPVPSLRLADIFETHIGDEPIDFMNLDVERTELSVLKSNDWARWRPAAILMESGDFSFDAPYADPAVAFLRDRGYVLNSKVGANVLMARAD